MNPLEHIQTPRLEEMRDRAELQAEYTANYIAMLERELLLRTMGQLPLEGI